MIDEHCERESKFVADSGWVLPDLSGVMPQAAVEVEQIRLISEYFDTDDRALLAFGATLRRRTGDGNTGWQLKLPAGKARTELHVPLTDGTARAPKELSVLVTGITAGARLRRLVTIRTDRTAHRWRTTAGNLLVEIADDRVRAESPGARVAIPEWREIEAELGPLGNGTLSDQIAGLLTTAGADRGSYPNKVAHAVGQPTPGPSTGKQTAGPIALDYLIKHHHQLLNGDVKLRRGEDAIHKTRVATRRLRSAIRVFSELFDPQRAVWLDEELSWYAGVLGDVRDPQVQWSRFAESLGETPDELQLGPVAANLQQHLLGDQARAREALEKALNSRRYLAMLADLRDWITEPPFSAPATAAPKTLKSAVSKTERKTADRLAAISRTDGEERNILLHRARKSAKRARYAVELARSAYGKKKAHKRIKKLTTIQDVLGEHQDSVVAAELLHRLGAATTSKPDENGFTYGLLYQQEIDRAAAARHRALKI